MSHHSESGVEQLLTIRTPFLLAPSGAFTESICAQHHASVLQVEQKIFGPI